MGINTKRLKMIAPSLLSADFSDLGKATNDVIQAGADWIHIDVMDGHFVPNLTIGAPVVKSLRQIEKAYLDCHLMISEPERYVPDFIKAGADNITLHIESDGNIPALLKKIQEQGVSAGITLRPATSLDKIKEILPWIDVVLVMTVEPGFGGQSFMTEQVEKISQLRQWIDENNYKAKIQVDGGVNDKTIHHLEDADVLVAGSYVFKNNYREAITRLKGEVL